MLYGYTMLHHKHNVLLEAAAVATSKRLHLFTLQEYALVVSAYGNFQYTPKHPGFFKNVLGVFERHYKSMTPQGVVVVLKALSKLKMKREPLLTEVMQHVLEHHLAEYSILEVSHLLYAFSNLGFTTPELYEAALKHMQTLVLQAAKLQQHNRIKYDIDSVVASCITAGHDVSSFVEFAEMQGFYVKDPSSSSMDEPADISGSGQQVRVADIQMSPPGSNADGETVTTDTSIAANGPDTQPKAASGTRGRDSNGAQRAAPAHLNRY